MKLVLAAAFIGFIALMLAYGCSRAIDRYRVCRGLGHGNLYCIAAAGESN